MDAVDGRNTSGEGGREGGNAKPCSALPWRSWALEDPNQSDNDMTFGGQTELGKFIKRVLHVFDGMSFSQVARLLRQMITLKEELNAESVGDSTGGTPAVTLANSRLPDRQTVAHAVSAEASVHQTTSTAAIPAEQQKQLDALCHSLPGLRELWEGT